MPEKTEKPTASPPPSEPPVKEETKSMFTGGETKVTEDPATGVHPLSSVTSVEETQKQETENAYPGVVGRAGGAADPAVAGNLGAPILEVTLLDTAISTKNRIDPDVKIESSLLDKLSAADIQAIAADRGYKDVQAASRRGARAQFEKAQSEDKAIEKRAEKDRLNPPKSNHPEA